ncbi:hypothetical protein KQX54_004557 [Cotesia glomerata]|uniref:Uncharacterized protein n=1 Tax=Cotesia glomerata TaxID=32391 RepID=A0AAV7HVW1_COTGL|nr:hypothetical protein KQX54_004557 [Cotesia glomerata]
MNDSRLYIFVSKKIFRVEYSVLYSRAERYISPCTGIVIKGASRSKSAPRPCGRSLVRILIRSDLRHTRLLHWCRHFRDLCAVEREIAAAFIVGEVDNNVIEFY